MFHAQNMRHELDHPSADRLVMERMRAMPGFAAPLGDDELAHLANYLRGGLGRPAPSDATAANVKALR